MRKLLLITTYMLSAYSTMANETTPGQFLRTNSLVTNLEKQELYFDVLLEENNIPWEGSYWAHRAGSIAYRHKKLDRLNFVVSMLNGVDSTLRNLRRSINRNSDRLLLMSNQQINKLSASEKYDILVGDKNFSLTQNILNKVENNDQRWGSTTWWTGICHGWGPAAIHFKSPRDSKFINAPFGHIIEFTPEDQKALASYFLATSISSKKPAFFGTRCNAKSPKQDSKTKLVLELKKFSRNKDECSDIKAHDFQNILINKLGINQQSFIADIDYNSPVNNHPIAGYKISFINKNGNTESFKAAIQKVKEVKNDVFHNLHSPQTIYLVQVQMAVHYVNWTKPGQVREDKKPKKRFLTKKYKYQLELDANYNIVGSHWLNKSKKVWAPDFLWYYPEETKFNEYYVNQTRDYKYQAGDIISGSFTEQILKSSNNSILLSYLNRLYLPKSQKLGILVNAQEYAKKNRIKLLETRSIFEKKLDEIGVRKSSANPHIISKVMYEILNKK